MPKKAAPKRLYSRRMTTVVRAKKRRQFYTERVRPIKPFFISISSFIDPNKKSTTKGLDGCLLRRSI